MASIDQYAHACIGIVQCPSTYPIIYCNNSHRNIPLYRLDQDVVSNSSFEGKRGDILRFRSSFSTVYVHLIGLAVWL
jgi:hypothetical protein